MVICFSNYSFQTRCPSSKTEFHCAFCSSVFKSLYVQSNISLLQNCQDTLVFFFLFHALYDPMTHRLFTDFSKARASSHGLYYVHIISAYRLCSCFTQSVPLFCSSCSFLFHATLGGTDDPSMSLTPFP